MNSDLIKVKLYAADHIDVIAFQPPLESAHIDALDDVLALEGPMHTAASYDKISPDIGDPYNQLVLLKKAEDIEIINPDRTLDVVAQEIVSILRSRRLKIEFEQEIESIDSLGLLFEARAFTARERLLNDYGVSPALARAWLEDTYKISPEEIREANPDGHGSHDVEAFVRIALSEDDKPLLLEEVYLQVGLDVEAKEKAEAERQGRKYHNLLSYESVVNDRQYEFREDSKKLRKKYAELV